ncbi:MAG: cation-translocating P-type ATPase, partial [Malacoplasma sp.]|nr:cation-translocating P-type ATPase [Malacoplasma sp.]
INAYKEIFKWKNLGMNTLIALSTGVSFFYSFVIMIIIFLNNNNLGIDTMYESGAVIITILMIGDLITDKIRKQANKDLSNLEHLQDNYVYVVNNKKIEKKDIKSVKINDTIFVSKGNRIPLDGVLLSKKALINESVITGESKPVVKRKNNNLLNGSINLGESIKLRVSNLLSDSYLNKIIEKIEELQSQKTNQQKLADKISKVFIPIVITFSILGFLIQFFLGNVFHVWYENQGLNLDYLITWSGPNLPATGYISLDQLSKSIYLFITILIIACPCSLGLAVPLAISVGSAKAMKNSILFNNIDVFEKMKFVNAVAFDKTGTLTTGNFILEKYIGKNNLSLIYQLESFSLHPLAKSYVEWFLKNNENLKLKKLNSKNIKEVPGIGIVYKEKNDIYTISSLHYVKEKRFFISNKINEEIANLPDNKLYSYIVLSKNKKVETIVVLVDELRPNVKKTIELFKKLKIKTFLITGDNKKTAYYLNKELNFDDIYFEVNPEQKKEIIQKIKQEGNFVSYVGDGLNDVLALESSDLKIVINEGSEIAKSVSEIILINGDIYNVYKSIKITLQTRKFITFNLIWAFAYNAISIVLAIFGFINPILAALIMSLSSISVLLNSLIFKFKKIK